MDARQVEIADAFERHFHRFGYKKTSLDEVAAELKISKKTIYAYFDSKEAILHFLVRRTSEQVLRQMASRLDSLPSASERLANLVRLIFSQARQFASERDPLDFEYEIAEAAFREAYRKQLSIVLEEGMRAGLFRRQSVEIEVTLLDGLIASALHLLIPGPLSRPVNPELVNMTVEAVLRIAR
jgi:AcrR family transcriptional regulator